MPIDVGGGAVRLASITPRPQSRLALEGWLIKQRTPSAFSGPLFSVTVCGEISFSGLWLCGN